jgi:hypothetical protein
MNLKNKIFYIDSRGIYDCSKDGITNLGSKGTEISFNLNLFDKKINEFKANRCKVDFIICIVSVDFVRKRDIEIGTYPLYFPDDVIFSDAKSAHPILFTGLMDLFPLENENEDRDKAMKKKLDLRYRFFDSCIWFRYVPLSAFGEDINDENRLLNVLKYFERNSELYRSNGAREFRDFQIRLFNESYVARFGFSESHAGHIVPFGFHSETKMERYATDEKSMLGNFKWNILLVDDYGNIDIIKTNKTKGVLIKELIGEDYLVCKKMEIAQSIKDGLVLLSDSKHSFDIILLDYYFESDGVDGSQFGEKFLVELFRPKVPDENNPNFHTRKLGHHGKYWIFPVSVYGNALGDKLKENKITWYDDKWVFSPGGDPINTPNLFRYKIYSFMRRQLEEYSVMDYSVINSKVNKKEFILYSELMKICLLILMNNVEYLFYNRWKITVNENFSISKLLRIYKSKKISKVDLQRNSFILFPKVVELGAKFKRLNKSRNTNQLAESIISKYFFNIDYIDWDHLQHLVYLLAYGNLSDHNLIWSESAYINDRIENEDKSKIIDSDAVLKTFIKAVLNYLE